MRLNCELWAEPFPQRVSSPCADVTEVWRLAPSRLGLGTVRATLSGRQAVTGYQAGGWNLCVFTEMALEHVGRRG